MIKVRNLTRKYGEFTAVNSISFDIAQGEIVGLLGHNGAGKTTTLKMLTGYLEQTAGDIEIQGIDITQDRLAVQKKIGYLSESSPLYPEMTVWQYLNYVAELRGMEESDRLHAVKEAVMATDLQGKVGDFINTLSKGYRQRVGVAQAIIHKPEILILDEPTNGLDPTQILAMRNLIKNLAKHSTVIISTHIMQEVEAICDRVIIVLNGKIAVDSPLTDLQKGNSITLRVKEAQGAVESALGSVSQIRKISEVSSQNGMYQYAIEADAADAESLTPMIAKTVLDKGWNLYGLSHEHRTLETVFKEVNRGGGNYHA